MRRPGKGAFRGVTITPTDALAVVVFAALAAFYATGLTRYLINDDEGSYLYAAWRISLGELPYADFLTPQLPGFLMPGGLLMRLAGPTVEAARAAAAASTLAAGAMLYLVVRRLLGPAAALVAAVTLLIHPDVFLDLRTFRPDAFMLLAVVAGFGVFSVAVLPRPGQRDPPRRRGLVVAGLLFGVGALTKLFAPFVMAGCGLWLVVDGWRGRRPWRGIAADLATLGAAAAIPVALGLGAFVALRTDVYGDVVEHHLSQGADLGPGAVLAKGLAFFRDYLRYHALEGFVAIGAAMAAWRSGHRRMGLFAWQLPTALVLLGLSRELFGRHLVYTLPAVSTLFAWTVVGLRRDGMAGYRWLGPVLVVALWGPWLLLDRDLAWRSEDGTARLADFVDLVTEPDEIVLADNSELNFYALRPTTYSAASLSAGAAGSGQITWARMKAELDAVGQGPALLLIDRTEVEGVGYGHFRFLRDLGDFEAWVAARYELAGTFVRRATLPDRQVYALYRPLGRRLTPMASFAGGPDLLAAGWPGQPDTVGSGDSILVKSAWVADEAPYPELALTLRLQDEAATEWAQADVGLTAAGDRTPPTWVAGEVTSQAVALAVPPGTPPGRYQVLLGIYGRRDGELVPRDDGAAGPMVTIGEITVTAWRPGRAELTRALPDLVKMGDRLGPVTLLGRGPLPEEVEAGQEMVVDTWWRVEEPMTASRLRVTLGDRREGTVAADLELAFGSPSAPPDGWPAGTVVRQPLRVPVLAGAAAGTASVAVEVDDSEAAILGPVRVVPRTGPVTTQAPPVDVAVAARFGAVMELVGASFDPPPALGPEPGSATARAGDAGNATGSEAVAPAADAAPDATPATNAAPAATPGTDAAPAVLTLDPGDALAVDLVWGALATMTVRYKVSVQIIGVSGAPLAQHDGEPADWSRPTTSWLPGEVIVDPHRLTVPADLEPGSYGLVVAVYDGASGLRLPMIGGQGAPGEALILARLDVAGAP